MLLAVGSDIPQLDSLEYRFEAQSDDSTTQHAFRIGQ
jgi:hypothetical protein